MSTTDTPQDKRATSVGRVQRACLVVLLCGAIAVPGMILSGCSKKPSQAKSSKTASEETSVTSGHMAGPPVEVHVPQSAVDNQPVKWDLSTSESAVRSYLDWVSYAYRIGQSDVATATMTPDEEVRMDSYNQYNLEKARLLEQNLDSITFGKASRGATSTLVPTKEKWTYSYLSVKEGNKPIAGPYNATYDVIYTVVKTPKGWVVDSLKAKAQGKVK